jgi:hypothetical protein
LDVLRSAWAMRCERCGAAVLLWGRRQTSLSM